MMISYEDLGFGGIKLTLLTFKSTWSLVTAFDFSSLESLLKLCWAMLMISACNTGS